MTRLLTALFFAIGLVEWVGAQETAALPRRIGVLFEGSFEKAEITTPIADARKTQLVAYYEWDFGVRPFTQATWKERGLDWDRLLPAARKVADELVGKVEPELVRDERGIILYAIISDKDPFLTSILLSQKLLGRFRETLGDRLHVILIDRHRIYLFPATGGQLTEFGPALVDEFRRTRLPVSLEVLLLDAEGYRVIGELERPGASGAYQSEP